MLWGILGGGVVVSGWEVYGEVPRVHLRKHVGGHAAAPVTHSIFQMRAEGRGHILWAILRCVLSPSVSAEGRAGARASAFRRQLFV